MDEKRKLREVASGLDVQRPEMERLRRIVANGESDAILVHDADRLYRDSVKLLSLCQHCLRRNVGLWFGPVENGYRVMALDGQLVVVGEVDDVKRGSAGVRVRRIFKMASDGFSLRERSRRLKRSDG